MPKQILELSPVEVKRLTWGTVKGVKKESDGRKRSIGEPCPAYHPVGGVSGLILVCRPPTGNAKEGSRQWILRAMVGAKRREIGLGGYPDVTLAQAREKAREIKDKIKQGIDPVAEKKALRSSLIAQQAKAVTFKMVAAEYIEKKGKEFKTIKQSQKLANHLKNYAYPTLGNLIVGDIERSHIVRMLEPIWETKTETASRVRLNVERILDLAGVKGLRTGDNPARWRGNLELSFAKREKVAKVEHYKALDVALMPEFWRLLIKQEWMGAKALQFLILTASRSGEVRGARWDEIDQAAKLWRVPAERMKGNKAHTVPLTDEAMMLLNTMPKTSDYLFASTKGGPLTDATISKVPKRIGYDVTAHGFRATFRTWAQEHTAYAEEVCELALAHVNDDKTRAAYARGELIDKRRLLMNDWARFCLVGETSTHSADVVAIGGAR